MSPDNFAFISRHAVTYEALEKHISFSLFDHIAKPLFVHAVAEEAC